MKKRVRRKTVGWRKGLCRMVDDGYRKFWGKRQRAVMVRTADKKEISQ